MIVFANGSITDMAIEQLQPWLSPDETVEGLEILTETAECLRNAAKFGSMRKEIRTRMENQAKQIDEFVSRTRHDRIDCAVMLALDAIARERKMSVILQITEALEAFVSSYNRRK